MVEFAAEMAFVGECSIRRSEGIGNGKRESWVGRWMSRGLLYHVVFIYSVLH